MPGVSLLSEEDRDRETEAECVVTHAAATIEFTCGLISVGPDKKKTLPVWLHQTKPGPKKEKLAQSDFPSVAAIIVFCDER